MPRLTILVCTSLLLLSLGGCESSSSAQAHAKSAPNVKGAASKERASPAPTADNSSAELVARGKQLVTLGGCHDCHTPMSFDPKLGMPVPDMTRMLSGHPAGAPDPKGQPGQGDQGVIGATFTSFRLPFGVVYAANLTPDRETGLGSWTREEFLQTMRTGHRRGNGRALLPPMPWQNLAQQSDADLAAIFAFLQSLPPQKNAVPAPSVPAPVLEGISKSYAALSAKLSHP